MFVFNGNSGSFGLFHFVKFNVSYLMDTVFFDNNIKLITHVS